MYTRCPACQSAFRVTAATLRAAHGQVVCATCHTTFDALFGLMDDAPPPVPLPQAAPETTADVLAKTTPQPTPEPEPTPAAEAEPESTAQPVPSARVDDEPPLDQVAAALAEAGAILDDLESPPSGDELTLLHIPGSPPDWVPVAPPQVAQAMAAALARDAAQGHPQPTTVELDDDAPTGTWEPLPATTSEPVDAAAPTPEPMTAAPSTTTAATEAPASFFRLTPEDEPEQWSAPEQWSERPPATSRRGWLWTGGSALLLLLLAAQASHHWREPLSRHPTLGGGITALYDALGIPVAPGRELLDLQVSQGMVGASPRPEALRVTAVITNRAKRARPLPLLQVTLEDRYGAPLGRRTFRPAEYAPSGTAADPMLLAAGRRVNATLDLADPGAAAVSFKLDLCLPAGSGLACASDLRPAENRP